ncbi:MAG TPA: DMT family transporter [Gaiellaceae bacterium]|nr:DMT family transporter [Gaiellaceae bacterium]
MSADRDRLTLAAFVLGSVLAGGNAVAIRFSNRELEPLWGAALRFALAALILIALMAALRLPLPRGRALGGALLFGLVQFGATFGLIYYALVELQAGFGQIVLALVPLLTLLVAIVERQERLRVAPLVGGLLALAGVVVMSRGALPASLPTLSVLAALGSALCFAQAAVLVRLLPAVHPVTMNAVGMSAGALTLFAAALLAGETIASPAGAATWSAVVYVVTFGSVAVFLLYVFVLREWEASRAAYSFVLIPVVTVALSAWLDDEPIGAALVVGGLLLLFGVYIGALRRAAETPAA